VGNVRRYLPEYLLLVTVMMGSVLGFWDIYFGVGAEPRFHHHMHVLTTFGWLFLLVFQLTLIGRAKYETHRRLGLIVFLAAPLLVATTATLSVHSAHRGVASGDGDALIVQNVMGTLELGILIVLAFLLRKNKKLHASFLLSTTILFLGIALFFALISFVPQFKIEGPETFYRFQSAGIAGQLICLAVGVLFFAKDVRNGWPFLIAGSVFILNEVIRSWLSGRDLIQPLTEVVGSMNATLTFVGTFALVAASLAATGLQMSPRRGAH
jgi:hypothetical protein